MPALPNELPFPLYHGTSTIWKKSILTHGLGGRKIVHELRALEFFREACAHIESMPENLRPEVSQTILDLIANQAVSEGGLNYRHNGLYLTPNRSAALRYAHNSFGSELVTECQRLYASILTRQTPPAWAETYTELAAVFRTPGQPLLICINHVRCGDLADEKGGAADKKIALLLELIEKEEKKKKDADGLRRLAKEGNLEAIATMFTTPFEAILTRDVILQELGNMFNFESRAIYPASEISFETPLQQPKIIAY